MKNKFLTLAFMLLLVISLTGCSKEAKEPENLEEEHKVVELYNCVKNTSDKAAGALIKETVSASIDDAGNVSGKVLYKYSYQTKYQSKFDEQCNHIKSSGKIPQDDIMCDSHNKIVKYSKEETSSYITKQEFEEEYVNRLGYECNSKEIKASN